MKKNFTSTNFTLFTKNEKELLQNFHASFYAFFLHAKKIFLFGGLLFCLWIFPVDISAQQTARRANMLFSEGQTLYVKEDQASLEQALNKFNEVRGIRSVLKDRSGEAAALVFMGKTYVKLRSPKNAVDNYISAISIFRTIGDKTGEGAVLNNLAVVLRENGEFRDALRYYQMAIPILRQHGSKADAARALNGIGQTYLALGDFQNAVANLKDSLAAWNAVTKNDDDKIRAISNLAIAYFRIGNRDETVKYGTQALMFARQRNNPALEVEILESLAQVYDETGDTKTAVGYRQKALDAYQRAGRGKIPETSWDTVVNNLGDLYYRTGDLTSAERILSENTRTQPVGATQQTQSYIFGSLGEVYLIKGEYDKAAQALQKGIELARQSQDKHSEAYNLANLGFVHLNKLDYHGAVEIFSKALTFFQTGKNPSVEARALSGLISAYTAGGNQNIANQLVKRAEDANLDKGNSVEAIQILRSIAAAKARFNENDKAIKKLETAIGFADGRGNFIEAVKLRTILSFSYKQANNHQKALEYFELVLKFWEKFGNKNVQANVLAGAGWSAFALNQTAKANDFAQRTLRLAETFSIPVLKNSYKISSFQLLGKTALQTKDFASAIKYFNQALEINKLVGDAVAQKALLSDIADAYEGAGDKKQAKAFRKLAKK